MNAKREALVDEMIRMYGFESEITIDFAKLAENFPKTKEFDDLLRIIVNYHFLQTNA